MIIFATSNRAPSDLYKNGLQRAEFLPFIDILEQYCVVVNLDSNVDYRTHANISEEKLSFDSENEKEEIESLVNQIITQQDPQGKLTKKEIQVLGRPIILNSCFKKLLVTNFSFMCEEARSAADYLALCHLFDVIVLKDIPTLESHNHNSLRRFITFVDVAYDNHILLIWSSKSSIPKGIFNLNNCQTSFQKFSSHDDGLWKSVDNFTKINEPKDDKTRVEQPKLASLFTLEEEIFAIDRTISRLVEMQSEVYIKETNFYKQNSNLNSGKR
jgi:peroxisome-assembly ATPase